jgi:hypothetical protein
MRPGTAAPVAGSDDLMDNEVYAIESEAGCAACADHGWVCDEHDDHCCPCGGAEKPCRCNPEAWLPDDFSAVAPADMRALSTAGALAFHQKF